MMKVGHYYYEDITCKILLEFSQKNVSSSYVLQNILNLVSGVEDIENEN